MQEILEFYDNLSKINTIWNGLFHKELIPFWFAPQRKIGDDFNEPSSRFVGGKSRKSDYLHILMNVQWNILYFV